MGKIDIEFRSKRSQRTVSCIDQGVCGAIIRRSEPFALEDSPERLGDIKCGLYGGRKRDTTHVSPILGRSFPHELHLWTLALSRTTKSVFNGYGEKIGQEVGNLVSGHILSCGEFFISIVASIMPKILKVSTSFRWDIDIFTPRNCHPYAHIPSVQMCFHLHNNVDGDNFFCCNEFLRFFGLIRIELRRGFPFGTFSYAVYSAPRTDKKA